MALSHSLTGSMGITSQPLFNNLSNGNILNIGVMVTNSYDPESVMMSRKDFLELADTIKMMSNVPEQYRKELALNLCQSFLKLNPNFDMVRFITQCGFKTT